MCGISTVSIKVGRPELKPKDKDKQSLPLYLVIGAAFFIIVIIWCTNAIINNHSYHSPSINENQTDPIMAQMSITPIPTINQSAPCPISNSTNKN